MSVNYPGFYPVNPYTMSDMVAEVRRLVYGTLTEQLNLIKKDYAPNQTEIFLDMDTSQIQPGMILSSDLNVWYVRNVNSGSRSVRVIPGYDNAPKVGGKAGDFVYIRPRMTEWYAFSQLNNQFRLLSAPGRGLYQVGSWLAPVNSTYQTYEIPRELPLYGEAFDSIVRIRYRLPGTPDVWYELQNKSYRVMDDKIQLLYNVPTGGAELEFTYRARFNQAKALTDDVGVDVGLQESAWDIPPLGVAINLIRTTESRRNQVQTQTDARRGAEVPPESNIMDATRLERQYNARVNEEYARQLREHPILMGI